jgi:hypothetical protein
MFQIVTNCSQDKTEKFEPKYWCKHNISDKMLVHNITSRAPPAMIQAEQNFSAVKSLTISSFQPMKNKVLTKEQFVSHVLKTKILIQTCMTHILKELLDTNFQNARTQCALPTTNFFCSQFKYITQLCQSKQLDTGLCEVPQTKVTKTKTAAKADKKKISADEKERLMQEAAAHEAMEVKEA